MYLGQEITKDGQRLVVSAIRVGQIYGTPIPDGMTPMDMGRKFDATHAVWIGPAVPVESAIGSIDRITVN
jgi:hypothetical protein